MGSRRVISSEDDRGFDSVSDSFWVNFDCTYDVPAVIVDTIERNGIGIVFVIRDVQVSIWMPSAHFEYMLIVPM